MEHNTPLTEKKTRERLQNVSALAIILAGLFAGSLFVDLVQLVSGSGFSKHVIEERDVLVAGNKTWVAYQEPKVAVKVISDKTCETCETTEALTWLRRILPTLEAETLDLADQEARVLIEQFQITALPAFVFSKEITQTEFYGQAESLFRENKKQYVFDMLQIGLPAGKYLTPPALTENDIVIGNREAPVKVVMYSDFECEYCREFYQQAIQASQEFGSDVALVFRHLPLSFHARAEEAAEASECAYQQGKFPEYASLLFEKQGEWSKETGSRWFTTAARTLRLDTRAFQSCLTSPALQTKLEADEASASEYGITGTPSTFVNGTLLSGAVDYAILKKNIEAALSSKE